MMDICPICGRHSLAPEYPPRPCPICEEEIPHKPMAAPPLTLTRQPEHQQTPERLPDA